MSSVATDPRFADLQFRVLIIGRANAGKTTILQRVCNTTESPIIYRNGKNITELGITEGRGQHEVTDEIKFSNHTGYIFHDSRGFEAGRKNELEIVKDFIKQQSRKGKPLKNRLHAIWYCIPMDQNRPDQEIRFLQEIRQMTNLVPVIVIFTKYEDFREKVEMDMEDEDLEGVTLEDECKKRFEMYYLNEIGGDYVALEGMDRPAASCKELILETMNTLSPHTMVLMLTAVQRENLEVSVEWAIKKVEEEKTIKAMIAQEKRKKIAQSCICAFPWLWSIVV